MWLILLFQIGQDAFEKLNNNAEKGKVEIGRRLSIYRPWTVNRTLCVRVGKSDAFTLVSDVLRMCPRTPTDMVWQIPILCASWLHLHLDLNVFAEINFLSTYFMLGLWGVQDSTLGGGMGCRALNALQHPSPSSKNMKKKTQFSRKVSETYLCTYVDGII